MTTTEIIKELCKKNGTSISALEQKLGYGNGSLSKAKSIPFERITDIAEYFNVSTEYFNPKKRITNSLRPDSKYYFDDETAEYADFLHKNPEHKVLFDASRKVKREDIDFIVQMIERTTSNGN